MELMLLRTFQRQAALQCKFILLAAQDIDTGLQKGDIEYTFYAVQNLLNASANVSKAFWGSGGKFATERKALRDSIGVDDNSSLKEVTMRNNFEHFDERLARWWKESQQHNHADLNLGPRNMIAGISDIDRFRAYDPTTKDLSFWGQDFNLQDLTDEAQRILPKLQAEANKPHWEERAAGSKG